MRIVRHRAASPDLHELLELCLGLFHLSPALKTEQISATAVASAPEAAALVLQNLVRRVELGPVDVPAMRPAAVSSRPDQK
jgi:hypothetical protein